MTPATASRVVLVCGILEAGYVLIRASKTEESTYKRLWAIGLLTLGLSIFADFIPQIAGPFAILVLVAMTVRERGTYGSLIGGMSSTRGPSTPSTSPSRPRRGPGSPRMGD